MAYTKNKMVKKQDKQMYWFLGIIAIVILIFSNKQGLFATLNSEDKIVGCRSTLYGYQQEEQPSYWVGAVDFISSKFPQSQPGIIYGIGGIWTPEGDCYLNFPNPSGTHLNVAFSDTDENEEYLDAYDDAGIDVWVQVEPGQANVDDLIELVFDQYGHHSSIMGFGVDVEWLDWNSGSNSEGRKVTDAEVTTWRNKVKSYDSDYKLFLKHWDGYYMPNIHLDDVVFIQDSELNENYNNWFNDLNGWADTFSDVDVGYQVGYPSDKSWWDNYDDPVSKLCNDLFSNIDNVDYCYWVDFSIQDVYTPSTVINHNTYNCYNNDIYWYDSNNVRNDKKEECGDLGCDLGSLICDETNEGESEGESFNIQEFLGNVLFDIGNFGVKVWMLIIGGLGLLLIIKQ